MSAPFNCLRPGVRPGNCAPVPSATSHFRAEPCKRYFYPSAIRSSERTWPGSAAVVEAAATARGYVGRGPQAARAASAPPGGLWSDGGSLRVTNSTLFSNGAGGSTGGSSGVDGLGGGIYVQSTASADDMRLQNTI